jgi:spermidine synthase
MVGFAASIGQILVIRELLVIFYGNELSTGLILACWLLCTAAGSGLTGRIYRKRPPGFKGLLMGFAAFCAALPATLVWIRAARPLWSIPSGELLSPGMMLTVAFFATAPFCFLSGALFAAAWELYRISTKGDERLIPVYLAESLGAGAGGLIFYFVLLPLCPSFAGSLALSAVLLSAAIAVGSGLQNPGQHPSKYAGKAFCLTVLGVILTASCVLFGYSDRVDLLTRHLQWGKRFYQSRDTPYNNLAFLFDSGQFSLFSNGLWLFSSPDPQTTEPAAHVPLLEHLHPEKVLLIGDCSPELPGEILKHPDITAIDCVQPDVEASAFTEAVLHLSQAKAGGDPRVRVRHMDPRRFMATGQRGYDVVLLCAGEPVNAGMNRFYTVEFFSRIKSVLNHGGLFSFGIASSPDIVGPREALLLKSLHTTLKEVFSRVLVLFGENTRFIASQDGTGLTRDPKVLIERMRERKLDLKYVRDFYLADLFNPLRMAYMDSVIREGPQARINRDYEPVCYLYALGLWGAQLHPAADRFLRFVSQGPVFPTLAVLGGAFFLLVMVLRARGGFSPAILFNAGVGGAVLIIVEVALLLIYQIMEGSVYRQMALIISFFMAGLAAGSALGRVGMHPGAPAGPPSVLFRKGAGRLFAIQICLAAYLTGLYFLFSVFRAPLLDNLGHGSLLLLFSALALVAGTFGGAQFYAAVSAGGNTTGAALYAADLIGASAGAVAGSLFFLPVLGIPKTLLMLGFGCLAASISLLRNRTE